MDDREPTEHEHLIARSRFLRKQAAETVATAKMIVARSKALIERQRDDGRESVITVSTE